MIAYTATDHRVASGVLTPHKAVILAIGTIPPIAVLIVSFLLWRKRSAAIALWASLAAFGFVAYGLTWLVNADLLNNAAFTPFQVSTAWSCVTLGAIYGLALTFRYVPVKGQHLKRQRQ
jgi:hypothetical protein